MISIIYFSLFASIAMGCGLYLLIAKHPLYGALALIGNMISLAGIYSLLSAPFLGVVQILTYAGAIMMLVVFVIMVLNTAHDHEVPRFDWRGVYLVPVPAALALLLLALVYFNSPVADATALRGTAQNISQFMFDTSRTDNGYWILFEFIGLLLLGAMVSAVLIAKKRLSTHKEDV
jgi:NADH-quinone oxidoreductase subunit J